MYMLICRICNMYFKFGIFREGFIFAKPKTLQNEEITLSFTDVGKIMP